MRPAILRTFADVNGLMNAEIEDSLKFQGRLLNLHIGGQRVEDSRLFVCGCWRQFVRDVLGNLGP